MVFEKENQLWKLRKITWNKGLTKETDERVRKNAENISKFGKGRIGKYVRTDYHRKINSLFNAFKGKKRPIHSKTMQERYLQGLWTPPAKNPDIAKKISKTRKERIKEGKIKIDIERNLFNLQKKIKPNVPEKKLNHILQTYFLNEWKYVGNGEVHLGLKTPDFININGKKKIIELFGRAYHDPKKTFRKEIPYHQTEEGTIKHYKKYGFDCLIIWDNELKDESQLLNRIKDFIVV